MEETKSCLFCYALDGQGGGQPADLSSVAPGDKRLVWIHLNGRHPEAKKFLRDQIHLDPLISKSLLAEETRPRLEEVGQNALIILRGINFNPGPTPEDLVSIRIWINQNLIVSVGRRKSRAVADIDDRIRQNRGPKRVGEFIAMLCSSLNDGIEPAILELEVNIDKLEEISLENPDAYLRNDIATMRKQATLFRRHMSPQRDAINRMQISQQGWLLAADKLLMQDNSDRILRFLEDLDAIRERSQILQDELYSALSSKLNKNLYVLSVITAIFMPLSFLASLLGMNVEGIPGARSPFAFGVVCSIAVLILMAQIALFKRLKWI
ncbi:MAG: zinc transporter ZntB [Alphaproteobacteria bacterium]